MKKLILLLLFLITSFAIAQENSETILEKLPKSTLKNFRVHKDKFTKSIFITLKGFENTKMKLYLVVSDEKISMRLHCIYASSSWIFAENVKFLIDEKIYEFTPTSFDRNVANGQAYESFDENVTENLEIIEAISNATKHMEVRFQGKGKFGDMMLRKDYAKPFKETLELYNLLLKIN